MNANWAMRILIVEDDSGLGADFRDYIKEIQVAPNSIHNGEDFDIALVGTAAEAKAWLRDSGNKSLPIDLIFLDLELPEHVGGTPRLEQGLEVLQFAQNIGATAEIVIISGHSDAINRARRLGARDFINKEDFRKEDIRREVIRVMNFLPRPFYSCFISYSSKNQEFATRLKNDLQGQGVRCWFAPQDLRIGDPFRQKIDDAIRLHDKLIIVLSACSVNSPWVQKEVETAFEVERQQDRTVLFPIRIDDSIMETKQPW